MVRVIVNGAKSGSGARQEKPLSADMAVVNQTAIRQAAAGWLAALPPTLRRMVSESLGQRIGELEEIRLRIERPLLLRLAQTELTIDRENRLCGELSRGYVITQADLEQTLEVLSRGSLYAWEDEFKNGYLTVPGGHRVGFAGRGVLEKGVIRTIREIAGFNYRIGHEIPGCADRLLPYLLKGREVYHTLIVSPPQCGKTTLLRDLVRQISDGEKQLGFAGANVGLVDERSELAGVYHGRPQFKIGLRTDVLDACPKAQGIMMLIRSMSPQVVATDEIGRPEDVEAILAAQSSGVSVITTLHGRDVDEIWDRPYLQDLGKLRIFQRIVVLSRRKGAGTIEAVYDGKTLAVLNKG